MINRKEYSYSKVQLFSLLLLRTLIGWHFLYEGVAKVMSPKWTAYGYLMDAKGIFASCYQSLAANPVAMEWVNWLNMAGLLAIGLGLILGCLERWAALGGILLLLLYYLSHIPYIGADYLLPMEGTYLWVDKNLIEMCALWVLFLFPVSRIFGVDRLWQKRKKIVNR